jgi:hypothetical protein
MSVYFFIDLIRARRPKGELIIDIMMEEDKMRILYETECDRH